MISADLLFGLVFICRLSSLNSWLKAARWPSLKRVDTHCLIRCLYWNYLSILLVLSLTRRFLAIICVVIINTFKLLSELLLRAHGLRVFFNPISSLLLLTSNLIFINVSIVWGVELLNVVERNLHYWRVRKSEQIRLLRNDLLAGRQVFLFEDWGNYVWFRFTWNCSI